MTLTEAIEILKDLKHTGRHSDHPDDRDAIELGIEALEHLQGCWEVRECERIWLLPSETQE